MFFEVRASDDFALAGVSGQGVGMSAQISAWFADCIAVRQRALIARRSQKPLSTLSDLERRRAFARTSAHAADGARNRTSNREPLSVCEP
jgi:hypothetical protein